MSEETLNSEVEVVDDAVVEEVSSEPASNEEAEASSEDSLGDAYDRVMSEPKKTPERGPDGKFISSAPVEDAPSEEDAAPGGETGEEAGEEDASPSAVSSPTIPAHLPGAVKEVMAGLEPEQQKVVADFVKAQDTKFGEIGRELDTYRPVAEVVNQYREYFDGTKANHNPAQAMASLFAVQRAMDSDPVGTLQKIAATYGVQNQLFQGTQGAAQEIAQLNQHIANLERMVGQMSDGSFVREQFSMMNMEQQIDQAIDSFQKEAPFYSEVEGILPQFVGMARERLGESAAPQEVLKTAYDMAVNAIPEVRAKAREAEKLEAAQTPDPKRKEAAKKASSINMKSRSTGKDAARSAEDQMAAVWDKHMNVA